MIYSNPHIPTPISLLTLICCTHAINLCHIVTRGRKESSCGWYGQRHMTYHWLCHWKVHAISDTQLSHSIKSPRCVLAEHLELGSEWENRVKVVKRKFSGGRSPPTHTVWAFNNKLHCIEILTVFQCASGTWIRWASLDCLIEGYNEELILMVFLETGHRACRRSSTM